MNWIQSFRKILKENWQRVHQREQRKKALRVGEMKWPTKCGFNINKFSRTEAIYNLLLTYMLHENAVAETELHMDWYTEMNRYMERDGYMESRYTESDWYTKALLHGEMSNDWE